MDELGERRVDALQAALMDLKAEIEVVVDDRMRLVEAAEIPERLGADQHAGAGHGDHVALGERKAEIAGIVGGREAEGMARQRPPGQKHPGMLHLAVGVKELGPDHAHLRPPRVVEQSLEPVRLDDLDVVVEEQ